jgi:hypothetical protein
MKPNIGMEKKLRGILLAVGIGLMAFAVAFPTPAWTQGQSADNMQILREKIKADKKLLVAANMGLTESEAKASTSASSSSSRATPRTIGPIP